MAVLDVFVNTLTSQYMEKVQSGHGKMTKQMWECLDKAEQ